jgi:CRP-like cAMP-binding protein
MPRREPSKFAKTNSASGVTAGNGREVQNKILLSLPNEECGKVFSKLEYVALPVRTVLNESGERIKEAYFVNGGLASVLNMMADGKSVEVGLCGSEGFVGVPLCAGFATSPARVIMQVAGSGFRLKAEDFQAALRDCPTLATAAYRFSQEMALQSAQVATCNRLHEIDARLARWLLMSQDRLGGDIVELTQEFLAHMLGTRRASVTIAAGVLQKAKIITYKRGVVKIASRAHLEQATCECYGIMKRQIAKWRSEVS